MQGIFNDELKRLLGQFMEMGINVSEQIYRATKSFVDHNREMAQETIALDDQINESEINLEKQALKLMLLKRPVASDFRKVIVVLKASSDLERIGDHAAGIARETIRIKGHQRDQIIEKEIAEMTNLIRVMLDFTIDAYVKKDQELIDDILEKSQEMEDRYQRIRKEILKSMKNDTDTITGGTGYLMVANYLQRIADHIRNVVEWIIYNQTGKIVELSVNKDDE